MIRVCIYEFKKFLRYAQIIWLKNDLKFAFKWGDYNYDYEISRRYDYHPNRYRFLKVEISEGDKSAEYTLKFNSTRRGLWIGSEPPRVCWCCYLHSPNDNTCQKVLSWKSHKFFLSLSFSLLTHLQGSILRRHPTHSHFKGTIQVIKAVANHLVLTFCESKQSELFTIILTRTKNIAVDVSTNLLSSFILSFHLVHEITISICVIIYVYI